MDDAAQSRSVALVQSALLSFQPGPTGPIADPVCKPYGRLQITPHSCAVVCTSTTRVSQLNEATRLLKNQRQESPRIRGASAHSSRFLHGGEDIYTHTLFYPPTFTTGGTLIRLTETYPHPVASLGVC